MKISFALSLAILLFLFNTCSENPIIDDGGDPGKRDYIWDTDSIDYEGLPTSIELNSIWGSSPSNVWGAGFTEDVRNCLWHYNGVVWKKAVDGTPITQGGNGSVEVGGVWGTAQNDVWAFGGRFFSDPDSVEPFVMHYNGEIWIEVLDEKDNMPTGFRDIHPIEKDHFWISSVDYVYLYQHGN